jgi:hypothetical protein
MSEPNDDSEPDSDPDVVCRRPPYPEFGAWYREGDPFDAFLAAVSALAGESGHCRIDADDSEDPDARITVPVTDARALLRRQYKRHEIESAWATFDFEAPSGRVIELLASVGLFRNPFAWFPVSHGNWGAFFPSEIPRLKRDGPYSMEVEAGVAWQIALQDSYEILVRLCRSSAAITYGGCIESLACGVPVTNGATYNADGYAGRDLALSWLHRHDRHHPTFHAGLSIDALREFIEAAPRGRSVPVIDAKHQLTREQVLAALALPPNDLLEALEAAAARPDPAWQHFEAECARVLGELEKADVDDVENVPVTDDHSRFIRDHSPSAVDHLDNGAIVLIAHSYRTLWPLWADALRLLDIRP